MEMPSNTCLLFNFLKAYGITNWSEEEQLRKTLTNTIQQMQKEKQLIDNKVEHINKLSTLKSNTSLIQVRVLVNSSSLANWFVVFTHKVKQIRRKKL